MRLATRLGIVIGGVLLAGDVRLAEAQFNSARATRTAARPSSVLGYVGGLNTLSSDLVARRQQFQPGLAFTPGSDFGLGRSAGPRLAPVETGLGIGDRLGERLGQTLPGSQLGDPLQIGPGGRRPGSARFARTFEVSPRYLAQLSGITAAISLDTPEGGWGVPIPRSIGAPVYNVRDIGEDPFQVAFGLKPAEPEPPADAAVADDADSDAASPVRNVWDVIDARADRRIAQMERRGREHFREAFQGNPEQRSENLARAAQLLAAVRGGDRGNYLAAVLCFHTALERGQFTVALENLAIAVSRRPEFLAEKPDLAPLFGTESAVQRHLQAFQRIGQNNPTFAEAYVIEAYCNLWLGDFTRANEAVENADRIAKDTGAERVIKTVTLAIRAAIP
ncbi:MAG: hypothetical protein AB7Q17_13010 [Phycisphaerae bacterium]